MLLVTDILQKEAKSTSSGFKLVKIVFFNNPLQRSEFYFKNLHIFWVYIYIYIYIYIMFSLTNNHFCHFLFVQLYERSALIRHPSRAVEYPWEKTKDSWHIIWPYITILVQILLPYIRAFVRCSIVW